MEGVGEGLQNAVAPNGPISKTEESIDTQFFFKVYRPPRLQATMIVRRNFQNLKRKRTYFAFPENLGSFIFAVISSPCVKFVL